MPCRDEPSQRDDAKGNPLQDLRVFQNPANLHLIVKGGVIYKRAL